MLATDVLWNGALETERSHIRCVRMGAMFGTDLFLDSAEIAQFVRPLPFVMTTWVSRLFA